MRDYETEKLFKPVIDLWISMFQSNIKLSRQFSHQCFLPPRNPAFYYKYHYQSTSRMSKKRPFNHSPGSPRNYFGWTVGKQFIFMPNQVLQDPSAVLTYSLRLEKSDLWLWILQQMSVRSYCFVYEPLCSETRWNLTGFCRLAAKPDIYYSYPVAWYKDHEVIEIFPKR